MLRKSSEKERLCGITCYVQGSLIAAQKRIDRACPCIEGVFKHRYSDFQVVEIDSEGNKACFQNPIPVKSGSLNQKKSRKRKPRDREKIFSRQRKKRALSLRRSLESSTAWKRYLCGTIKQSSNRAEGKPEARPKEDKPVTVNKAGERWVKYLVDGYIEEPSNGPEIPIAVDTEPLALSKEQKGAIRKLESLVGNVATENFRKLLTDKSAIVLFPASDDKSVRRQVHQIIKCFRPFSIVADTICADSKDSSIENAKKIVRARCNTTGGNAIQRKFDSRGFREQWPPGRGDYAKFVMYKENMDTTSAISAIGKLLRIKAHKRLNIAGTKDKRAVTTQFVTGYRLTLEQLARINERSSGLCGAIWVGNGEYCERPKFLGDLRGNQFQIVLRDVKLTSNVEQGVTPPPAQRDKLAEHVKAGMETISDVGFINYFGLQRFGTGEVATHIIGRAILRGEWKKAVELIMHPQKRDKPRVAEAKKMLFQENKAGQASRMIPHYMIIEKAVATALATQGSQNYSTALASLPRHVRQLYVHAYQSFIWNKVVSARFQELGEWKVLEGDLVLADHKEGSEYKNATVGEPARVKLVTEEDVRNEVYSINDVVFPLVGNGVMFPKNPHAKAMTDALKEDGVAIENTRSSVYDLRGCYRHLLVKATDTSWEVKDYVGRDNSTLCQDMSEEGLALIEGALNQKRGSCSGDNDTLKRTAAVLKFSLPKSSYATMCLREIFELLQ